MQRRLLSIAKLLFAAALVMTGTTEAFAYGNSMYNVYNTKVQTYPAGAGKVYVQEDDGTPDPALEDYTSIAVYKNVVYDDDTHSCKPYCLPTTGNKLMWGGWKQLSDEDLADIKNTVYDYDNVKLNPSYVNLDCVESYEEEAAANAAMAKSPTNNLVACFTAAKASVQDGYESLGGVEIFPVVSNFGDTVKINLSTTHSDVHVGKWIVNGIALDAKKDTFTIANIADTMNIVMVPTSENLIAVNFPEEGGYKSVFVPAGHEARIINYNFDGTILRPSNFQADFSSFLTTNGNTTSTYLGGGTAGTTYLIYGKGAQEYFVYEDQYQWDTPTYLYTAQNNMTVENGDTLYYTWNAAKTQFDPTKGMTEFSAGDIYLAIPKDVVKYPALSITLSEEKHTVPSQPSAPSYDYDGLATDGSRTQYLWNKDAKGFLLGANDWNTRASVSASKGYKWKVQALEDGKYTLTDSVETQSEWKKMFADNATSIWVDNNNGANCNAWEIEYTDDDQTYFYIKNSAAAAGILAVVPANNDTRLYLSEAEDAQGTWYPVSEKGYANYIEQYNQYLADVAAYDAAQNEWYSNAINENMNTPGMDITSLFPQLDAATCNKGGWTIPANWTIETENQNGAFHVNTWSTEGNSDGTQMVTPFFERWVGGGATLNACDMYTTLEGLTPNAKYELTSLFRVLFENGGVQVNNVNFYANDATIDVCTNGQAVEQGSTKDKGVYGTMTIIAKADAEGKIKVGVKVLDGTTASWVTWKNMTIKVADVDPLPGYYLFKNKRSGRYAAWTSDNTQIAQSSDLTVASVWKVLLSDDSYKLGNYATSNYYVGHSEFTAEGAPVYLLQSEFNEGYYVVSLTADASANCWDDQSSSTAVGYWQPSASDNQGTSWEMVPVTKEEIEQLILNNDMSKLLSEVTTVYNSNSVYTKSAGLITSVDQLSSPYTESSEGSLDNLLDGDASTFWHSVWSNGDAENGVHYLEIALPDNTLGLIELDYTRRPVSGDQLTKADIVGVDADGNTETVATLDLPYGSSTETLTPTFTLDKAYKAIRILEQATTKNRGYWHASEIQLYSVALDKDCFNAKNPNAAAALAEALEAAKQVENATEQDITTLQNAYAAYLNGDDPTAISTISVKAQQSIYNIAGQKLSKLTRGINIVNGKKIIIK